MMRDSEIGTDLRALAVSIRSLLGPGWLLLAIAGMAAFYWTGLVSLPEAWRRPEFSHGYFVPFIALFLLLRKARALDYGADRQWAGIGVVLLALAVGLIGNLASIADVVTYGLLMCIAGVVLLVFGFHAGLKLWAPVAYLVFMLPLPSFVYWPLSTKLQHVSSRIGTSIISAMGIPVYLDGNVVDLGTYKLQVAEACSGLNYLFPLLSFGFLVAVIYKGPAWHKVVLFLSAVPITIAMNCVRIAMVGLLVDSFGAGQAEGFLHLFEGWVIFVACLVLLLIEALLLQQLSSNPKPLSALIDLGSDGLSASARRIAALVPSKGLVASASLIALAGLVWYVAQSDAITTPPQIARQSFATFPQEFGEWTAKEEVLEPAISQVLGADDYLLADYRPRDGSAAVNVFIAYYSSQVSGNGIHSPEVCIPAGGWEVSQWERASAGFRLPSGQPLWVNRAEIQKGLNRQVVYYWFEQRGRPMTNSYAAKFSTLWDSVVKGRTDGALVRLVTPIGSGETERDTDARLARFLDVFYPMLPTFVPGTAVES